MAQPAETSNAQASASRAYRVVDLFCGAGGLAEGFRQAGYHIIAGNDNDPAWQPPALTRWT